MRKKLAFTNCVFDLKKIIKKFAKNNKMLYNEVWYVFFWKNTRKYMSINAKDGKHGKHE